MESKKIKDLLIKTLALQEAHVVSDDGRHFQIIAVSEQFIGMSRIKKQQMIYAPLMEYFSDNRIHSLSIKAYTPNEWQSARKLNIF